MAGQIVDRDALEVLKEVGADDADFLPRILRLFLTSVPPQLERLKQHLAKGEARELAGVAHGLLSSTRNVGAEALSELLVGIENAGKAQKLNDAGPLVAQIDSIYSKTKIVLQEILNAPT